MDSPFYFCAVAALSSITPPFPQRKGIAPRVPRRRAHLLSLFRGSRSTSLRVTRGLDPRVHLLRMEIDCRVKPGNDVG